MWAATFTEVKWVGIYIDESIMLNLNDRKLVYA